LTLDCNVFPERGEGKELVEENVEVDRTCRIRGPNGAICTVTDAIGAEQLGELQVIAAEVRQ
jgi:hypothetical protein